MTWWSWSSKKKAVTTNWKIVIGLGNPGYQYVGTRHNVGFEVIGRLADRLAVRAKEKFSGEWSEAPFGELRVGLLRPLTFMNRSGRSAREVVDFYRLPISDLLVVCDDFHLETGRLRWRAMGTAGGQKGLADIIRQLGTDQFPRLRIGIGCPPPRWDPADYVLSKFRDEEMETIQNAIQRAADGVEDWIQRGIEHCMNKYNAKSTP
jgi:PTH1 family peptidyl-tRNA hydrolase